MRDKESGRLIGGVLSSQSLEAVGKVAVESSKLETEIEYFVWVICGQNEESGRVITDRMQMDGKLGLLRDLTNIRILTDEMRSDFKNITDTISDLIPKRNTIIHGEWHGTLSAIVKKLPESKSYPIAVRIKRNQKNIPVVQAKDIEKIAIRLAHVRVQLLAFYLENLERLLSSPRRA